MKPPVPGHFKSEWDSLALDTADMWFQPLAAADSDDLGIRIFLKNHDLIKDNEILTPVVYKMLDTLLGEKSFALDISYVDTDLQPDNPEDEGLYPILELPAFVAWHKSNHPANNH